MISYSEQRRHVHLAPDILFPDSLPVRHNVRLFGKCLAVYISQTYISHVARPISRESTRSSTFNITTGQYEGTQVAHWEVNFLSPDPSQARSN